MISVVDDEVEIFRTGIVVGPLIGDVDSDHFSASTGCRETQAAIAGREFQQDGIGSQVGSQQAHLALDVATRFLFCFPPGEARMVRDSFEQLVVEGREQLRSLRAIGFAQPSGQLPLDLVVVAESFKRAFLRFHGNSIMGHLDARIQSRPISSICDEEKANPQKKVHSNNWCAAKDNALVIRFSQGNVFLEKAVETPQ